jgi:hypothetical protein
MSPAMNEKPHKSPDVVLAERFLLLTMCVRHAISEGNWDALPSHMRERENLLSQLAELDLTSEAIEVLDKAQDEASFIFAEMRLERARLVDEIRSVDAGQKSRSAYRLNSDSHPGVCDETA